MRNVHFQSRSSQIRHKNPVNVTQLLLKSARSVLVEPALKRPSPPHPSLLPLPSVVLMPLDSSNHPECCCWRAPGITMPKHTSFISSLYLWLSLSLPVGPRSPTDVCIGCPPPSRRAEGRGSSWMREVSHLNVQKALCLFDKGPGSVGLLLSGKTIKMWWI